MNRSVLLHTDTALAQGLRELFQQLEDKLQLSRPIKVYLAGGMAVHLYTANRVTTDVDAEFAARIVLPRDVFVPIVLEDGTEQIVFLDTNYNPTLGMLSEDYLDRVIPVDLGVENLQIYLLSPVDLAVSKLARYAENDRNDIAALVDEGLVTSAELQAVAEEAASYYIGAVNMLKFNIRDAVALARAVELENALSSEDVPPNTPAEMAQRIAALPSLKHLDGAARAFGEHAARALIDAGNAVDWQAVERASISESIERHGLDAEDVADALCLHSPAALTRDRRIWIRAWAQMCANPVAPAR